MRILPILFLSLGLLAAGCDRVGGGSDFDKIAEFTVTSTDGDELQFASLKGTPTLIDIWATWCPPCIEGLPKLDALRKEYAERGLRVIAVSSESQEEVESFADATGYGFLYFDATGRAVEDALGVKAYPTTFLFDAEGRLVEKWVGLHPADEYEKAISRLGLD